MCTADRLLRPGGALVGYVATTASGGFRQSPDQAAAAWRPAGSQGWNTRDSFLTIGGGFNSGNWSGNGSTAGDPFWTVDGVDTFNTAGIANANNVPFTAGWYIAGSVAQARSLETLQNRIVSSSASAAEGMRGVLVAHLYIADPNWSIVLWDMSASVRRADGSVHQGSGAFQLQIPSPGGLAVIGGALAVRGRRRRAS